MKTYQSGFNRVQILLVAAAIAVIVGAGVYIAYDNNQQNNATRSSGSSSTVQKAQGVNANTQDIAGQTPYNSNDWVKVSLPEFVKISVPDGWQIENEDSRLFYSKLGAGQSALEYKSGTRAVIEKVQSGGRDGLDTRLFATVDDSTQVASRSSELDKGKKIGTLTSKGFTFTIYEYTATSNDSVGIGAIPVGTKEYTYYATFKGNQGNSGVYVKYTLKPNEKSQKEAVEAALKTADFATTD